LGKTRQLCFLDGKKKKKGREVFSQEGRKGDFPNKLDEATSSRTKEDCIPRESRLWVRGSLSHHKKEIDHFISP